MESSFKLIQESLKMGTWKWYPESGQLIWDDYQYKLYGIDSSIPITYDLWSSMVHPNDLESLMSHAQKLLEDPEFAFDFSFRAKKSDSTIIWLKTIAKMMKDEDGIDYMLGINFDVSDSIKQSIEVSNLNKKNQETLDRLELALNSSNTGIFDWDIRGDHLTWDDQMFSIFGLESRDQKEIYEHWNKSILPEDREDLNQNIELAVNGSAPFDTKFRIRRPNGETRWIKARGKVFFSENQKAERMLGTNCDITELQHNEDMIAEQSRVNMNQSRLAAIGELSSGVGHEINNPLAIVCGYTKKMMKLVEKNKLNADELTTILNKQEAASDRIAKIVESLRAFSRKDAEQMKPFSLNNSINQTQNLVREMYQKDSIELINESPEENIYINGFEGRIQQVLMNLLTNSRDALREVSRENKFIKVNVKVIDDIVALSVTDNGSGVDKEIQSKIFNNFFTTKEVGVGGGIGLALSADIIKQHHGRIEYNKLSENTEFVIHLPLHRLKDKELDKTEQNLLPLKDKAVLIVDDEKEVREILSDLLEEAGMKVLEADNGLSAVKVVEKQKLDFIITDLQMPKMDGENLLTCLDRMNLEQKPFYLAMTGGLTEKLTNKEENSLSFFIDGHILKPFQSSEILQTLLSVLNRS
ncbi:PAS domain-containing protein [Bacteriovoracaceae bacterium]|nr:PAS domain-containing protein [Bacteriovoracaceae bacterium]